MAKQPEKAPKIKVGELKKVVGDLKTRTEDLKSKYFQTKDDISKGMAQGQKGVAEMQSMRSREIQHNMGKINRYSRIADSATIVHDKARLAEKQAAFKRDYPLSPTFKSEM